MIFGRMDANATKSQTLAVYKPQRFSATKVSVAMPADSRCERRFELVLELAMKIAGECQ